MNDESIRFPGIWTSPSAVPPPLDGAPQRIGNVVFPPDLLGVEVTFDGPGTGGWVSILTCPARKPLERVGTIDVPRWVRGGTIGGASQRRVTTDGPWMPVAGTVAKPGHC
jgi:hypothetical protein